MAVSTTTLVGELNTTASDEDDNNNADDSLCPPLALNQPIKNSSLHVFVSSTSIV